VKELYVSEITEKHINFKYPDDYVVQFFQLEGYRLLLICAYIRYFSSCLSYYHL